MTGLIGQFDPAWALADLHPSVLTEDDPWEPRAVADTASAAAGVAE